MSTTVGPIAGRNSESTRGMMASVVAESWARFNAALPKLKLADAALAAEASEAVLEAFEEGHSAELAHAGTCCRPD